MIGDKVYRDNCHKLGRVLGEFSENGTEYVALALSPTKHPVSIMTIVKKATTEVSREELIDEFRIEIKALLRRFEFLGMTQDEIMAGMDEAFYEFKNI